MRTNRINRPSPPLVSVCVITFNHKNYINICLDNILSQETEYQTARKLNSLLYNTINFKNHPTPNIIIGDSRIRRFPTTEIEKITGDKYFILHSNAAKLNEIIDLFWIHLSKSLV